MEKPLPDCFVEKFKWERPEQQSETLERFLTEREIAVVINQRCQDRGLIGNLQAACAPHGVKVFSVFHSAPGFEFITAHRGWRGLLRKAYNVLVLRRKWAAHYQEVVDHSDRLVMLASGFIAQVKRVYSLKAAPERIISIPNPCTLPGNPDSRKERVLLVVSRLEETPKRLSMVFRLWRAIAERYPSWRLVVVGDGANRPMYEAYCQTHRLPRVSFEGVKSPEAYYEAGTIFLMTSTYEGWGLTLVEAMAYGGVPVAMDTFAAVRDIIDDGRNGLLTPGGDLQAYIKAVTSLMDTPDRLAAMSREAYVKSQTFVPAVIAERWERLF